MLMIQLLPKIGPNHRWNHSSENWHVTHKQKQAKMKLCFPYQTKLLFNWMNLIWAPKHHCKFTRLSHVQYKMLSFSQIRDLSWGDEQWAKKQASWIFIIGHCCILISHLDVGFHCSQDTRVLDVFIAFWLIFKTVIVVTGNNTFT